jgi:hypothetical protein
MNTHIWWSVKVAFQMLCVLGSVVFVLWLAAVVVSAWGCRPRRGSHRVGGVWKP